MNESVVEEATIEYLKDLGYDYVDGLEISPDGMSPERASYGDVILAGRLQAALARINPHLDADILDGVAKRILRPESPSLEENNFAFQGWLTRGVEVQVRKDGRVRGDQAWLIDFENPDNNDWLVLNQFTVVEGKHNRRPDVVVFVNGMPLAVIELKNPQNENATIQSAWNQLQTYKSQIPSLFATNELLVISDGMEAKVGSLTAGLERFGPWRTVDGSELAPDAAPKLEVLIQGLFEKRRLLDYIRHFVLWETDDGYIKKIAGYHQFHAVNKAVEATVRASSPEGDKRIGVVWHTQGSGKSILMAFYAAKLTLSEEMKNPTIVVITDRNDLDGQLYAQFCAAKGLLPAPAQAESRDHLKELLQVASGGIVFSTIQKFGVPKGEHFPELSDRRNIVVITDEAHRSQYEFIEGFARNLRDGLPNASFIGFTGTPIEFSDRSTPAVFGDYVDTYTISQSVEDKATVPIYYEARLAKIALPEENKPELDEDFEEVTEGEEESTKGKLKSKWARLEAMVGTEERLSLIAQDIVDHFDRRTEILEGKAMIVTMSRRIAVDLYDQIVKLRPEWDSDDDETGAIKVVMTGNASDPLAFQKHNRNKPQQSKIEKRFKDPDDPLRLVIVRDMWLTGFDAPCAHTLYVDKPMKGHGLMQAIARVNRVFKDKPSGPGGGLHRPCRATQGRNQQLRGREGRTPGHPHGSGPGSTARKVRNREGYVPRVRLLGLLREGQQGARGRIGRGRELRLRPQHRAPVGLGEKAPRHHLSGLATPGRSRPTGASGHPGRRKPGSRPPKHRSTGILPHRRCGNRKRPALRIHDSCAASAARRTGPRPGRAHERQQGAGASSRTPHLQTPGAPRRVTMGEGRQEEGSRDSAGAALQDRCQPLYQDESSR